MELVLLALVLFAATGYVLAIKKSNLNENNQL